MNLNWNDTHGWDNIDRRYNIPKGNGRITRNIKDFNNSSLNLVAALSRVSMYIREEKNNKKKKIIFESKNTLGTIYKYVRKINRLGLNEQYWYN